MPSRFPGALAAAKVKAACLRYARSEGSEGAGTATGKLPWYFTRTDGEPMTFAGLWDEWKDKATGEALKSCTMPISEPNDFVAEVHDRMPVVLKSEDFASWLNHGGAALLKPAANDVLQRWPVSRRVNSSRAPNR